MAESADTDPTPLRKEYALIERQAGTYMSTEDANRLDGFGRALEGTDPEGEGAGDLGRDYSPSTIRQYLLRLRVDLSTAETELSSATASAVNERLEALDADRARSTTVQAQSAAKLFYRFHRDLGVDPGDISVFEAERSATGPARADELTGEDLDALRREIDASGYPVRNRALLELLVHTGERIGTLQSLRLRDVRPDAAPPHLRLDGDAGGTGRRIPLQGARRYARTWKQRHPRRGDPEAWYFVGRPTHGSTSADRPWSTSEMRRTLYRAADRAGIDKPVHPEALRHYGADSTTGRPTADESTWAEIKALLLEHPDRLRRLLEGESTAG